MWKHVPADASTPPPRWGHGSAAIMPGADGLSTAMYVLHGAQNFDLVSSDLHRLTFDALGQPVWEVISACPGDPRIMFVMVPIEQGVLVNSGRATNTTVNPSMDDTWLLPSNISSGWQRVLAGSNMPLSGTAATTIQVHP